MPVLIYTPTYDGLLRPETVASVKAQIADVEWVWEVSDHNPYPGRDMRNVLEQYRRAWQLARDGGYDALLTVEHDMVLPPDALQKLWDTPAPVVYGVYMLRHGVKALNAWQLSGRKALGMTLSLYPKELRAARARGWAEVSGVGWGCTLIRREVFSAVSLHQAGDQDAGDTAFATDCLRRGYRQIARFDVPCGHIEPDGFELRPYANGGGIVYRVLARQRVIVNAEGKSITMEPGRYYSLPPQTALDAARAGYCTITNDDDSQQEAGEREQPDITAREMAVDPRVTKRATRKAK